MSVNQAYRWIRIAERDLTVAIGLHETFPDTAAYHYQQAAEKFLKGFLAANLVPLKKSHSITSLILSACEIDPEFFALAKQADPEVLTSFATMYRYPNEEEEDFPDPIELDAARVFCESARDLVASKIEHLHAQVEDEKGGLARPPTS